MIPADSTGRTPLTVGIDIGGTKTLAIAVDAFGDIVGQVRIPSGYGAENVIAAAVEAVVRLREELPEHRIDRVGIGIPGTVDHESGEVEQALNLGLESVALGAALEARLGVPVHVENDVNAAALGAIQVPSAAGSSLAYLNLGTGLAAGIVLDGRLWRGVSGAAGEIGHVPIDPEGPECVCGQRGCLEVMASGSGIARQWEASGEEAPAAIELSERARSGVPLAAEVFGRLVWAVASAVRLLVLAHDVERVVIGGGLADALGPRLIDPVLRTLAEWEAASPFLASVAPSARAVLAPVDVPLAAVGAAIAASDSAGTPGDADARPLTEPEAARNG